MGHAVKYFNNKGSARVSGDPVSVSKQVVRLMKLNYNLRNRNITVYNDKYSQARLDKPVN